MICKKRETFIDDVSDSIKYYDMHTVIYDDIVELEYELYIVYTPQLEDINVYTYNISTREIVFDFNMPYKYLDLTDSSFGQAILFLIQQHTLNEWIKAHYDYRLLEEMAKYVLDNLYFDMDAIHCACYGFKNETGMAKDIV